MIVYELYKVKNKEAKNNNQVLSISLLLINLLSLFILFNYTNDNMDVVVNFVNENRLKAVYTPLYFLFTYVPLFTVIYFLKRKIFFFDRVKIIRKELANTIKRKYSFLYLSLSLALLLISFYLVLKSL